MRKRYLFGSGLAVLAILLTLVVWQVSFTFGDYGPSQRGRRPFVFWAVSTLIFLLTVTLGFMLFRDRRQAVPGAAAQPRRLAHQIEAGFRRAGAEPAPGGVPGAVQLRDPEPQSGQMVQRPGGGRANNLVRDAAALWATRCRAARMRWRIGLPRCRKCRTAPRTSPSCAARTESPHGDPRIDGRPPGIVCPAAPLAPLASLFSSRAGWPDGTLVAARRAPQSICRKRKARSSAT